MKQIFLVTELLIKPSRGIYLVTTYYTDGSIEQIEVPKGKIILPSPFFLWEFL